MRIFICLITFSLIALADETTSSESLTPVIEPISNNITERLEKIENQLNNNTLLEMLESVDSLKMEINSLRGEIEVQTHNLDKLKEKQRDLYTDLDSRLGSLETIGTNNNVTSDITVINGSDVDDLEILDATGSNVGLVDENNLKTEEALVIETTSNIGANNEIDTAEEPFDPMAAEMNYRDAFKLLKESQYEKALEEFKSFLKIYPNSDYSSNAQYWIGEANYVMQRYEIAINEYQALLNTYPESQKVSHALLKIGYSFTELGNIADAKKILKDVVRQYPDTTASKLAEERLRKIN
ncbi:MAG: tol-pal system protein YbgF [Gammaproteobacteria bacterium]